MLHRKQIPTIILTAILLSFLFTFPILAAELSPADWEKKVEKFAETHEQTQGGVAIAALQNGELLFEKTYGYENAAKKIPITSDSVFEWASGSKLLVWTAVMQLVEQQKLELDQDIRRYLPVDFLKKLTSDKPITLLHLMHHTAGWIEDADLYYEKENEIPVLSETLQNYEPKQVYAPGKTMVYSSFGAALAGYIVELQSKQPFYEYVQQYIFAPLGMTKTTMHPAQADNLAVKKLRDRMQGYTTGGSLVENSRAYFCFYPAGAAVGSLRDAEKFLSALLPKGKDKSPLFQSRETLDTMLTPSLCYNGSDVPRNAHGFIVSEGKANLLGHSGSTTAFSCQFQLDTASKTALIILTNQTSESDYCFTLLQELMKVDLGYNYKVKANGQTERISTPYSDRLQEMKKDSGHLVPIMLLSIVLLVSVRASMKKMQQKQKQEHQQPRSRRRR